MRSKSYRVSGQKNQDHYSNNDILWYASWNDLRYKHIKPIKSNEGEVVAAKITIYAISDEQYSFCHKREYLAIDE